MEKTRYAIVGTGGRSAMYRDALLNTFAETCELVAACDLNPLRAEAWQSDLDEKLPIYEPARFEDMIREQKVDKVIVTSMDRTHDRYICAAMEAGCDVITEKPMTIDADRCRRILETQARTGKDLAVTFNYRYSPRVTKVRELLRDGAIGTITSVHFEWLLDTKHGADYFRRWHRDKRNSGGLLVHKATHHFDIINWWIGAVPQTVFAQGDLKFYGRENAENRGVTRFYQRALDNEIAAEDPFALDLRKNDDLRRLYLEAEPADGYQRDQSVFSDGISIEDDMSVIIRYDTGAIMSYHLTAYSPWEGYRVAFNGTEGRLEFEVVETPYVSGADDDHNTVRNVKGSVPYEVEEPVKLVLHRHWQPPVQIEVPQTNQGGHGGGDERLLRDLFGDGREDDPLGRAAGSRDGAYSIICGIAANESLKTGLPVDVATLLPGLK